MIIDTGARTDTVQYYTDWLLRRFAEGHVLVRNPLFPRMVTRYELDPAVVDCVVFCSKDYRPILPRLREITDRFHTYFHYTITAYGRDIEPGVPSIEESIETLRELSSIVGARRVVWRYDPVLLTRAYGIARHVDTFAYMAEALAPHVDRCVFSFVEIYKKLEVNMPELSPLSEGEMDDIARGLGAIAGRHGLRIQTCGTKGDFRRYDIAPSGCVTLDALGRANGVEFKALEHRGMRKGCGCIESRDIGAYDTCLNGCRYCYANESPDVARENYARHDPLSPLLLGHLEDGDTVRRGTQRSYLTRAPRGQLSLGLEGGHGPDGA